MISVIPTAMVRVRIGDIDIGLVRTICDGGSQPNLMTQNLLSKYGINGIRMNMALSGITGDVTRVRQRIKAKIYPWFDSNEFIEIYFWILPKDSKWNVILPDRNIRPREASLSAEMNLADPLFWKPEKISMLLGIGAWAKIVKPNLNQISATLIQQDTKFGSVVMGDTGGTPIEMQ